MSLGGRQTPSVLILEPCDFVAYPIGGQLTSALHLMHAFGSDVGLVGLTSDDDPIGVWQTKSFYDGEFDFFAVGRCARDARRPLIPDRLKAFVEFRWHREAISSLGVRHALIQAPEVLISVESSCWDGICYRFPGVSNPLDVSRYWYGSIFAGLFEQVFFRHLAKADVLIGTADQEAIQGLVEGSRGRLLNRTIHFLPTHVDTEMFFPRDKRDVREKLGLPQDKLLCVTCGRLGWIKGWDFLLQSFRTFHTKRPDSEFLFIGDGEDREKVDAMAKMLGLSTTVRITGFKPSSEVAAYLAAADLFVMGSLREGWPTAMVEALASGVPIVTTRVSGASEIVHNGRNGYVVEGRSPEGFADAMEQALRLKDVAQVSLGLTERYALKNLRRDMEKVWPALERPRSALTSMQSTRGTNNEIK